jgi:hypothetical protein
MDKVSNVWSGTDPLLLWMQFVSAFSQPVEFHDLFDFFGLVHDTVGHLVQLLEEECSNKL